MTKEERKKQAVSYLAKAKADMPLATQAGQIKWAIARFILDELGVEDPKTRNDVASAFMETPSFFGASANAMQEVDGYVKKVNKLDELMKQVQA